MRPLQRRCHAVLEPTRDCVYHGRCDRERGHTGAHELERGLDIVRWTTTVVLSHAATIEPASPR